MTAWALDPDNRFQVMLADLRYGFRLLVRAPAFAAAAAFTLALGIGANGAIFSIVHTVLIEPLPYKDSNRLVHVYDEFHRLGLSRIQLSAPELADLEDMSRTFEGFGVYQMMAANLTEGSQPERLDGARVSGRFFTVIGVPPRAGRWIEDRDAQGSQTVVMISEALAEREFGGDAAIGRVVHLDGQPSTIVGVMPSRFALPFAEMSFWVPLERPPAGAKRGLRTFNVIARVRADRSVDHASADLLEFAARLRERHPNDYPPDFGWSMSLLPLRERLVGDVRPMLLALTAAVVVVLLIACANVANLLLARATGRQREMAIRAAVGGSPGRLARQMLVETLVLAACGGVVGLLMLAWSLDLLGAATRDVLPIVRDVGMTRQVFWMLGALTLLTALLCGSAPAVNAFRQSPAAVLKAGPSYPARQRATSVVAVAQVAMAVALLVATGLVIKSFMRLTGVNPGFDPGGALSFQLVFPETSDLARRRQLLDGVLSEVRSLSQVSHVGAVMNLPIAGGNYDWTVTIEHGNVLAGSTQPTADYNPATPGYFAALRIPLIEGRDFTDADRTTAEPVAVVSEDFARRYVPGASAIGRRFKLGAPDSVRPWTRIVGVVGDVRPRGLASEIRPAFYVPITQASTPLGSVAVVVRSSADPGTLVSAIRARVRSIDPGQPLSRVATLSAVVSRSIADRRVAALLFTLFGGIALALATIGLYAVMAFYVSNRLHEIGVRVALGAERRDVVKLVMGRGLALAAAGAGLGLAAAAATTRWLERLLFGVTPLDPTTYLGVTFLVLSVAALSFYLPVRHAVRVDPLPVLRAE
jgi:putative ABC transport system permease protein